MNLQDLQSAFLIFVLFQLKHYISDFPLQRPYMLRKGEDTWTFVLPLSLHCGVHASFTLAIVLWYQPQLWWLAIFDFCVHFTMDRIKSGPRYLGRFNDVGKTPFWICLGFDQLVHHLTHYFIIYQIIKGIYFTP